MATSQIWTSPQYATGSVKWTSTASNRLLIEGGYSFNIERYNITNQPGIDQQRGTAAWYAGASRRDLTLATHYASLDQDLVQQVRFVLAPGAAAAIGGTTCTAANASGPGGVMQFKAHKSVYGQAGSAWNGWVMSEIAPRNRGTEPSAVSWPLPAIQCRSRLE